MIGYQASSKYPDGTILMVTGDESDGRDKTIGEFVAFRTGYEEETGTSKFPNPAPKPAASTSYEQGVENTRVLTQADPNAGGYAHPAPPGSANRPGDGELHPTKTCNICHAPRKVVDRVSDKTGKRYRKLECSVDYHHTPHDWSENYK